MIILCAYRALRVVVFLPQLGSAELSRMAQPTARSAVIFFPAESPAALW